MKSLSSFLAIIFAFAIAANCYAQDAEPVAADGVVAGEVEANGQSAMYSFDVKPGDLAISVDAATNFQNSSFDLILRDAEEAELLNCKVNASPANRTQVLKAKIQTPQKLTLQLMFAMTIGVRVKYALRLSGSAVGAPAPGAIVASVPKNVAPVLIPDVVPTRSPAPSAPVEDKWALVIGISEFAKPGVNLKYSAKDAKDFAKFLVDEAHFAPDHVKLLVNAEATKERVLAEIGDKWLPRVAHPNDLVLIFISTHGSSSKLDLEGLNYLLMHNSDPDSLYATGLPLQELAAAIRQRVHAERVVLIVDACHSGAANPAKGISRTAGNVDSENLAQGTGQLVICSSEPQQVSWESVRYPNSVFTHQLIEALRSSNKNAPTLKDAFVKLKESVQSEVLSDRKELQSPVLKSKWQGDDLILTAPPSKPRTPPN